LLQRADLLIRNDQRNTIRKIATELSVSKERVSNITDALGYLNVCGFHEAQRLSRNRAERRFFSFAHRYEADRKAFSTDPQFRKTMDPSLLTLTKEGQWSGLYPNSPSTKKLQQGTSWPMLF
jgi:hypothetical protein